MQFLFSSSMVVDLLLLSRNRCIGETTSGSRTNRSTIRGGMEWAMLFLFVGLKVPLLALCWLVWWAIHQVDDVAEDGGDGGSRRHRPHPPGPLPRLPRRGPHGDPAPQPPPRVRPAAARARELVDR
jgi:hypothetical protein